jgi:hypothetical protein
MAKHAAAYSEACEERQLLLEARGPDALGEIVSVADFFTVRL